MPSIMAVDDEEDILRILEYYVRRRGYNFALFSDPLKAMAHFRENTTKYDLIISDIRMPGMSGLELAENIARLNTNVKIVLMTAYEMPQDQPKTIQIAERMKKPFAMKDFGAMLDRQLGSSAGGRLSAVLF